MPNASLMGDACDPNAGFCELAGIKRELLVTQNLPSDITRQTGHHAHPDIRCTKGSAVHRTLKSIGDENVSRHLGKDPGSENKHCYPSEGYNAGASPLTHR